MMPLKAQTHSQAPQELSVITHGGDSVENAQSDEWWFMH